MSWAPSAWLGGAGAASAVMLHYSDTAPSMLPPGDVTVPCCQSGAWDGKMGCVSGTKITSRADLVLRIVLRAED